MSITFSDVTFSGGVQIFAPGAEPPPPPPGDPYWSNVVLLINTGTANNLNTDPYDVSLNNFTVSTSGYTGSYSPYPSTSNTIPYSPTGNSGSLAIDNSSGEAFQVTNNAAIQANTGDFTIDTWVFPFTQSTPTTRGITGKGSSPATGWEMYLNTANILQVVTANITSNTGVKVNSNAWTHIAWSRSGTNSNIYVNGNLAITISDSYNYNQANILYAGIGRNGATSTTTYLNGLISDYRFVKGTAVYTANFTVPSVPLTAITNTSLLVPGYSGIFDSTRLNYFNTPDSYCKTSNAVTKFGNTSITMFGPNSTTGELSLNLGYTAPLAANLQFGTGNFTVEGWMYKTGTGALQIISREDSQGTSAGWALFLTSTGNMALRINGINYTSNTPVTGNVWNHFALVRDGNTANVYLNGNSAITRNVSGVTFGNFYSTKLGRASRSEGGTGANVWRGYMEQIRITKGVARYTANFEVPTAAFPTFYGNP